MVLPDSFVYILIVHVVDAVLDPVYVGLLCPLVLL